MSKEAINIFPHDKRAVILGSTAGCMCFLLCLLKIIFPLYTPFICFSIIGILLAALLYAAPIQLSGEKIFRHNLLMAFLVSCSTAFGCICGWQFPLKIAVALIFVVLFALTIESSALFSSIAFYTVLMYIVASGLPQTYLVAIYYGLSAGAGIVLLGIAYRVLFLFFGDLGEALPSMDEQLKKMPFSLGHRTALYALTLTTAVVISFCIAEILKLNHGYWVPVTTFFILKSDANLTRKLMHNRFFGTLSGLAATGVLLLITENSWLLAAALVPLVFFTVTSSYNLNNQALVFFITIVLVVLFVWFQQSSLSMVLARFSDTLIGIVITGITIGVILPECLKR